MSACENVPKDTRNNYINIMPKLELNETMILIIDINNLILTSIT